MDRIRGWETRNLRRLFRMKKHETVEGYCSRTASTVRSMWKQHVKLPFLTELIAEEPEA